MSNETKRQTRVEPHVALLAAAYLAVPIMNPRWSEVDDAMSAALEQACGVLGISVDSLDYNSHEIFNMARDAVEKLRIDYVGQPAK